MSSLSLIPEEKRRMRSNDTTINKSMESLYSSSSSKLSAIQNRRRTMTTKNVRQSSSTGDGPSVMSEIKQRVKSARLLRVKNLQNQLNDAQLHVVELSNENRLLRTLHKRQDTALSKYEHSNSELPQLLHSHAEEIRILQAKYRTLQQQNRELSTKLKHKDQLLLALTDQNKHLMQLNRDKNLEDREKLADRLRFTELRTIEKDEEIKLLARRQQLEMKNFKTQLANEHTKYKELLQKYEKLQIDTNNRNGFETHSSLNSRTSASAITRLPIKCIRNFTKTPLIQLNNNKGNVNPVGSNENLNVSSGLLHNSLENTTEFVNQIRRRSPSNNLEKNQKDLIITPIQKLSSSLPNPNPNIHHHHNQHLQTNNKHCLTTATIPTSSTSSSSSSSKSPNSLNVSISPKYLDSLTQHSKSKSTTDSVQNGIINLKKSRQFNGIAIGSNSKIGNYQLNEILDNESEYDSEKSDTNDTIKFNLNLKQVDSDHESYDGSNDYNDNDDDGEQQQPILEEVNEMTRKQQDRKYHQTPRIKNSINYENLLNGSTGGNVINDEKPNDNDQSPINKLKENDDDDNDSENDIDYNNYNVNNEDDDEEEEEEEEDDDDDDDDNSKDNFKNDFKKLHLDMHSQFLENEKLLDDHCTDTINTTMALIDNDKYSLGTKKTTADTTQQIRHFSVRPTQSMNKTIHTQAKRQNLDPKQKTKLLETLKAIGSKNTNSSSSLDS